MLIPLPGKPQITEVTNSSVASKIILLKFYIEVLFYWVYTYIVLLETMCSELHEDRVGDLLPVQQCNTDSLLIFSIFVQRMTG